MNNFILVLIVGTLTFLITLLSIDSKYNLKGKNMEYTYNIQSSKPNVIELKNNILIKIIDIENIILQDNNILINMYGSTFYKEEFNTKNEALDRFNYFKDNL